MLREKRKEEQDTPRTYFLLIVATAVEHTGQRLRIYLSAVSEPVDPCSLSPPSSLRENRMCARARRPCTQRRRRSDVRSAPQCCQAHGSRRTRLEADGRVARRPQRGRKPKRVCRPAVSASASARAQPAFDDASVWRRSRSSLSIPTLALDVCRRGDVPDLFEQQQLPARRLHMITATTTTTISASMVFPRHSRFPPFCDVSHRSCRLPHLS